MILLFLSIVWLLGGIMLTQHAAWIEMLVYPYLLNNGFVLYKDLISPYTPLLLWILQFLEKIFGYTPQFSLGLTAVLAITNTFSIWIVSQKLWKSNVTSGLSVFFYSIWFFYFEGNGLWFELFQTSFIIWAFYFYNRYFFRGTKQLDLLMGSLFLATSFFIKQSVFWIALVISAWLLLNFLKNFRKLLTNLLIFAASFAILLFLTIMVILKEGSIIDYLQWIFVYTFLQFPSAVGHNNFPTYPQFIKLGIPFVILLPLIGKVLKKQKEEIFTFIFILATFMAVFPRWGLFHLQPTLAIVSISTIPLVIKWMENKIYWRKFLICVILILWGIVITRQLLRFWNQPIRFFEPEVYRLAQSLQNKGYQDIFTFNSFDQLYILTNTIPKVKPYVQNFSWYLELPGMQEKVIDSLESKKPEFIIFTPFLDGDEESFKIGYYQPKLLKSYIDQNYLIKDKLSDDVWILERKK